jgi:hypothetical protein
MHITVIGRGGQIPSEALVGVVSEQISSRYQGMHPGWLVHKQGQLVSLDVLEKVPSHSVGEVFGELASTCRE